MSTIRLDPPIVLWIPHLKDYMDAWFLHDYGLEHDNYWTGPLRKNGQIWTFNNTMVRAPRNITLERVYKKNEEEKGVEE